MFYVFHRLLGTLIGRVSDIIANPDNSESWSMKGIDLLRLMYIEKSIVNLNPSFLMSKVAEIH